MQVLCNVRGNGNNNIQIYQRVIVRMGEKNFIQGPAHHPEGYSNFITRTMKYILYWISQRATLLYLQKRLVLKCPLSTIQGRCSSRIHVRAYVLLAYPYIFVICLYKLLHFKKTLFIYRAIFPSQALIRTASHKVTKWEAMRISNPWMGKMLPGYVYIVYITK